MEHHILERLGSLSDEPYRTFTQALIPDGKPLLGVRMGPLRSLAKELATQRWNPLATKSDDRFHEQTLLRALVIASLNISELERIAMAEQFLPEIDNWAVCDSMCSTFSKVGEQIVMPILVDQASHQGRASLLRYGFARSCCSLHFLELPYLPIVHELLETAETEHYHVRMALAWAAATSYIRYPRSKRIVAESRPFPGDDAHDHPENQGLAAGLSRRQGVGRNPQGMKKVLDGSTRPRPLETFSGSINTSWRQLRMPSRPTRRSH